MIELACLNEPAEPWHPMMSLLLHAPAVSLKSNLLSSAMLSLDMIRTREEIKDQNVFNFSESYFTLEFPCMHFL